MATEKRARRTFTKSQQMARVRGKDTGPEMVLRRALWQSGIRYRLHPLLPGKPDLAFPSRKLAVFVDGCFWHGCPIHYKSPRSNVGFWSQKIERNRRRDEEVNCDLGKLGWNVLRFWEHELEGQLPTVLYQINDALKFGLIVKRGGHPAKSPT